MGQSGAANTTHRHFLLCREEELLKLDAELGSAAWLHAVSYGENYKDLLPFIAGLANAEESFEAYGENCKDLLPSLAGLTKAGETFEAASRRARNLVRQLSPRDKLDAEFARHAMMKIGDVTAFKVPAGKTEADITIKQLIDDGFEKDKSQPRQRLPILDAQGRSKYVLHRSTIDEFVAPKKHPPDVDESTLTLKDLLEEPNLRDYIVNSFMALSEDATLADAKYLFDMNPLCLDILVTQGGWKNGIVVGWITNRMVLNAATI